MAFDETDLHFQLFEVARADRFIERHPDLDREAVEAMLEAAAQVARDVVEPTGTITDEQEPFQRNGKVVLPDVTKDAFDAVRDTGLTAASFPAEVGGLGLPRVVCESLAFIFNTANVSIGGYSLLTVGAARLIHTFGTDEQKETFLTPMVDGRFTGTMCLSEPHAGSSLTDITTKATPSDDGTYSISGNKMWISGGEHELSENIVHMVLAKLPDAPDGVKGISLFIVPRYRLDDAGMPTIDNDVSLASLNHKMGFRGTTNCALNFGERGNCVGYLVGKPHHGLGYMFQMMNEARLGVGMGAVALGQAGYQAALAYAKERPQGRPLGTKDPKSAQVNIIEHTDVRRLLLAQKAAVEPALALGLYCAALADDEETTTDTEEKTRCHHLLELLTPIAKSWSSEFCLEANKHAIQVLGGAGYTRDYPVERLYRDNRLNAIHEGTHGIQGLDLLGRKVVMENGAAFKTLYAVISEDIHRAEELEGAKDLAPVLAAKIAGAGKVTQHLAGEMMRSPADGLANATLYLDYMGHIVMGWMWLRLVIAAETAATAGNSSEPFLRGKRQAATYYFKRELPRTDGWASTLLSNDLSAHEMQPEWF